jgi:hypothetical protein
MKPKSPTSANWMLSLGMLASALTGCAHQTIRLEAVDVNGRTPLAGVTTEWREHRYQMFRPITHYPPTNLPPTGQPGVVEIRGLHRNWRSTFIFSCPGYSNIYGRYSGGTLQLGTNAVFYADGMLEGDFQFEGDTEIAIKSNGCFVIAMPK